MTDLQKRIAQLEATINDLKQSMRKEGIDELVMATVAKEPLTIDELTARVKATRAIVNKAVRRLAFLEKVKMVSEKGNRKPRFRVYPAALVNLSKNSSVRSPQ